MENLKYKRFSPLENILINIIEEGQAEIWQYVENIACPVKRSKERMLYFEALKKLNIN